MRAPDGPTISVITATRNARTLLAGAIDSVRAQPTDLCEFVVVDGASTDGTVELLRDSADAVDRWLSEPDAGIYDALNKGVRLARGRWICFLGADDRLEPCLGEVADHLRNPRAVYYGDVRLASDGTPYGGRFDRHRLMLTNICHQGMFFPRRLLLAAPYPIRRYRLLADHVWNLGLWAAGVPFVHLPLCIATFDDRGQSTAGDPEFEHDRLRLVRRWFGDGDYLWLRYRLLRNRCKRLLLEQP